MRATVSNNLADLRFVFAGNRGYVLEEMLNVGVSTLKVAALEGSYLARSLDASQKVYYPINNRVQFLDWLGSLEFDVLVANGLPHRIPIKEFSKNKLFVNIHPSFLPDLKGADPVPGALLFGRDSGATCHLMDDGYDTGPIIAQIKIPHTSDLDAPLLYQLSFIAERMVFRAAIQRNFVPTGTQVSTPNDIYYSKKPEDNYIDLGKSSAEVISRVRAFANRSQGGRIRHREIELRVYGAALLVNQFLNECRNDYIENEVVLNYEGNLVIRKGTGFIKLGPIDGRLDEVGIGHILGSTL